MHNAVTTAAGFGVLPKKNLNCKSNGTSEKKPGSASGCSSTGNQDVEHNVLLKKTMKFY